MALDTAGAQSKRSASTARVAAKSKVGAGFATSLPCRSLSMSPRASSRCASRVSWSSSTILTQGRSPTGADAGSVCLSERAWNAASMVLASLKRVSPSMRSKYFEFCLKTANSTLNPTRALALSTGAEEDGCWPGPILDAACCFLADFSVALEFSKTQSKTTSPASVISTSLGRAAVEFGGSEASPFALVPAASSIWPIFGVRQPLQNVTVRNNHGL